MGVECECSSWPSSGCFASAAHTWCSNFVRVCLGNKVLNGVGIKGSPRAVGLSEHEALIVRVCVVADFRVRYAGQVVHAVDEVGAEKV